VRFRDFPAAEVVDADLLDGYDMEVDAKVTNLGEVLFGGWQVMLTGRVGKQIVGWVPIPNGTVYVVRESEA
jgi:hypothetical protein